MSKQSAASLPRLLIAGLGGGSGKTFVSLGLCTVLARKGLKVQPYKKGPDYIDANWLSLAAGLPAINLDPFLFAPEKVPSLFVHHMLGADMAIIEGNRGLFDGMDVTGSCSSAEIARMLAAPVVLVIDCTKVTRTVAALVLGCRQFEPGLNLAGVILNRTAGSRHRQILRDSIERYTDVPVLGALPRRKENPLPERHMGLVSDREQEQPAKIFSQLASMLRDSVDIEAVQQIAFRAPSLSAASDLPSVSFEQEVRIGVASDQAFCFYYQDNLEALQREGAQIVPVSLLDSTQWPRIDALYLGGGFPETMAGDLAGNVRTRGHVRELAQRGMPVYAECGGLMYLGQQIEFQGQQHAMSGVLPVYSVLHARPQGHGYVRVRVSRPNPYFPVELECNGHEFHYSTCTPSDASIKHAFSMIRGVGMGNKVDGIVYKNVFAAYTHLHALGVPCWAKNFVRAARIFRQNQSLCPDIRIEKESA